MALSTETLERVTRWITARIIRCWCYWLFEEPPWECVLLPPDELEPEPDFESDLESVDFLSDDSFLLDPDLDSPSDSDFAPLADAREDAALSLRYQPLPLKWRAAAEILR